MMIRQTYYISREVGENLRRLAHARDIKISRLVNEALRRFLSLSERPSRRRHSLLEAAGKIRAFKNLDPVAYQRRLRGEWE